ncbi:MAG: hypothetical protein IPI67_08715 [Myxococcales bacterium]|nr:hypothetical protein [Myxococcales bacterium]
MRANLVFLILLGLFGVLGVSLATRQLSPHVTVAPSASAEPSLSTSASASAAATASVAPSSSAAGAGADAGTQGLGRPLRVTGSAWDVLAPIALANGGLSTKKDSDVDKSGLSVSLSIAPDTAAIEAGLARGGSDEAGRDVAVLPLAELVASYQKLQALRPVVIWVSAWSRGREVVHGKQPLHKLPATGEIALAGTTDASSTLLSLFALDLSGASPSRVRLVERGDAKLSVSAMLKSELRPGEQKDVLLSTTEAMRFSPYVVVCSASMVEQHASVLSSFLKDWMLGDQRISSDPALAARTIAAIDGAPEPIALLGRLGELTSVGLADNAELFALSGRGALTVEALFARMWRLRRNTKLESQPAPERSPIVSSLVAALVRKDPSAAKPAGVATPNKPQAGTQPRATLVARIPGPFDADLVKNELGFLAGVFERSPLRLSAGDKAQGERLAREASERFGLPDGRIRAGTAARLGDGQTVVEILPVP